MLCCVLFKENKMTTLSLSCPPSLSCPSSPQSNPSWNENGRGRGSIKQQRKNAKQVTPSPLVLGDSVMVLFPPEDKPDRQVTIIPPHLNQKWIYLKAKNERRKQLQILAQQFINAGTDVPVDLMDTVQSLDCQDEVFFWNIVNPPKGKVLF